MRGGEHAASLYDAGQGGGANGTARGEGRAGQLALECGVWGVVSLADVVVVVDLQELLKTGGDEDPRIRYVYYSTKYYVLTRYLNGDAVWAGVEVTASKLVSLECKSMILILCQKLTAVSCA